MTTPTRNDVAAPAGTASAGSAPVDDALADLLGDERAAVWRLPRSGYRPELSIVRSDGGTPSAAVLTSARPATAATKIVDVWWRNDASRADAAALVDGVLSAADQRGDVAVKWQVLPEAGDAVAEFAAAAGFAELRRPWAASGTESTRGFVRWLAPTDHVEPGYYAQTTLFTCGAVAALIAADGLGRVGLAGGETADLELELGFWRRASNYPACEPVGLAVALRERLERPVVDVALDHHAPVLVEDYTGFELDFRAELQRRSAREAVALGIPLRHDRVAVDEIRRRVGEGRFALLLIDEAPMHGDTGPHWIVAHGTAGDAVLVQDPWINVAAGETWVDTHDLPVMPAGLDRLVRWGAEGYRGVIFAG